MYARRFLVALVVAATVLAAVSAWAADIEGQAGRTGRMDHAPARIVALAPSVAEMV